MTYVAKPEYCHNCGKWHSKFIDGCPYAPEQLSDPVPQLSPPYKVDKTTNTRGSYLTLFFNCPYCGDNRVLLKSNYCHKCGVKLIWE